MTHKEREHTEPKQTVACVKELHATVSAADPMDGQPSVRLLIRDRTGGVQVQVLAGAS